MTSIKDAIKKWEAAHPGQPAAEAERVELLGQCPPVERMDAAALGALKACRHLSLSTNSIDRIAGLGGAPAASGAALAGAASAGAASAAAAAPALPRLEVLSLGRNLIKRIEGLEGVSETLRELWLSYNQIEKLTGLERCQNLRVLYLSNNRVKDWPEVDRLAALPRLADLLLSGNPVQGAAPAGHSGGDRDWGLPAYRLEVLRRVPGLAKLDGVPCDTEERERAAAAAAAAAGPGGAEGAGGAEAAGGGGDGAASVATGAAGGGGGGGDVASPPAAGAANDAAAATGKGPSRPTTARKAPAAASAAAAAAASYRPPSAAGGARRPGSKGGK